MRWTGWWCKCPKNRSDAVGRGLHPAWAILALFALTGAGLAQDGTIVRSPPADCLGVITAAEYDGPTGRYDHGILGDAIEWGALHLTTRGSGTCTGQTPDVEVTLPETMVFEDTAPRLADITGDGTPEVITVETRIDLGARLAVWGITATGVARIAVTPFIGATHRWLAPVGAADLDGDGTVEIAFVDRPHLTRELAVWRYDNGSFAEIARTSGLTNHRIGDPTISGGIRDCGDGPELITADSRWQTVMATRLVGTRLVSRSIGSLTGRDGFTKALACR